MVIEMVQGASSSIWVNLSIFQNDWQFQTFSSIRKNVQWIQQFFAFKQINESHCWNVFCFACDKSKCKGVNTGYDPKVLGM